MDYLSVSKKIFVEHMLHISMNTITYEKELWTLIPDVISGRGKI